VDDDAEAAQEASVGDDAAPSSACGRGTEQADGRIDPLQDENQGVVHVHSCSC